MVLRTAGVLRWVVFLARRFTGTNWLTGGSVGPEGSYLVLVVLALGTLGIHLLFPRPSAALNHSGDFDERSAR
jgi:hypothetical protein